MILEAETERREALIKIIFINNIKLNNTLINKYSLLSVELLIENLEDDPVLIAEYKTNSTKIPILTKFSEPKCIFELSGADVLNISAKLVLHLSSKKYIKKQIKTV